MTMFMPEQKDPTPPPPAPNKTDAEITAMVDAQRKKYAGFGGRSSTMVTGGMGVPGWSATKTPMLGGGVGA